MIKNYFVKRYEQWIHSKQKEIAYAMAFVLLIWFVMYPEFSITADCCRIVDENGQVVEYEMTDRELALAVLEAGDDEIVIKSSFWEMIMQWSEEIHAKESDS